MANLDDLLQQRAQLEQNAQLPEPTSGQNVVGAVGGLLSKDRDALGGMQRVKQAIQQQPKEQLEFQRQQNENLQKNALEQRAQALSKVDSPETKQLQSGMKKAVNAVLPKLDTSFVDIMPGDQLGKLGVKDVLNLAIESEKSKQAINQRATGAADKQRQLDEKKVDEHIKILRGVMRAAGPQTDLGRSINRVTLSNDLLNSIDKFNEGEFAGTKEAASEVITGLNNLLTNSNASTVEGFKNLFPTNARGDVRHMIQEITGKPQRYLEPQMLSQIENLIGRQNKFWGAEYNAQVNAARNQLKNEFTRNSDLKDIFNNTLNEFVRARNRGQTTDAEQQAPQGGLTPAEQARMNELLAKKKAGTLGK